MQQFPFNFWLRHKKTSRFTFGKKISFVLGLSNERYCQSYTFDQDLKPLESRSEVAVDTDMARRKNAHRAAFSVARS